MTIGPPINRTDSWQWECLEMTYANGTSETDFTGESAVSGNGYVLEQNELIKWDSIMVCVQTAEVSSNQLLNVGLMYAENSNGGNAAGFLYHVSIASTGYVRPTWTLTSISSVGYYISASTLGAYFLKGNAGNSAQAGEPIYQDYMGGGVQKTLTYTVNPSGATGTTFVGWLLFQRMKMPNLSRYMVGTY